MNMLNERGHPRRGYDALTPVKAARSHSAVHVDGGKVFIPVNAIGIIDPDDDGVTYDDTQFVHFQLGDQTPCVTFPVRALDLAM